MLTEDDIAAVEFPIVKWEQGYEIDDVDALVARVRETLAGISAAPIAAADVDAARRAIYPTKFRNGYQRLAVDQFLVRATEALQNHES